MPKMKTKKSASKRFRFTATGKVKRSRAFTSHILTKKSTKRKRQLRGTTTANARDVAHVRAMMPYAG
jgi:large subunit ribosomal protein L35